MTAPHTFPDPAADYLERGTLERVPADVSRLATAPGQAIADAAIGLRFAPAFLHTRIENFQPPAYYEEYLMTATYSEKMQAHQAGQAARLARLHGRAASLIEIGCGDGSFLRHARGHIGRVVGIEPSRAFAAEARAAGFEVLEGYVGTGNLLTTETFDLFASRQVFEHLPDPVEVLRGIGRMLRPGAVGLIEVPNGLRSLREARFYEFFPDHVNYYSVNSLVGLATAAGLGVIECGESFGGDYLELWLRHEPALDAAFDALRRQRELTCRSLADQVQTLHDTGAGPVAVWGCGAKTLSILSAAPPALRGQIACVFDSDPHKHGRYVPNSAIPVVGPDRAPEFAPRTVFVLALSYREEIASLIRERIPSCRQILTVDDAGGIAPL